MAIAGYGGGRGQHRHPGLQLLAVASLCRWLYNFRWQSPAPKPPPFPTSQPAEEPAAATHTSPRATSLGQASLRCGHDADSHPLGSKQTHKPAPCTPYSGAQNRRAQVHTRGVTGTDRRNWGEPRVCSGSAHMPQAGLGCMAQGRDLQPQDWFKGGRGEVQTAGWAGVPG